MATLGVRRMKERGGAGGKVAAGMPNSKPLTPLTDKAKALLSVSISINRSTGKEKPRSVSRGPAASQKPAIHHMPRIDRPVAVGSIGGDAEARRRLSSSSVPRGRSSSPSDFTRILSDMRRTRVSRVPVSENRRPDSETSAVRVGNGKGMSGFRGLERKGARESGLKASEKRVHGDMKENVYIGAKLVRDCGKVSAWISAAVDENDLKSSLNESAPEKIEALYDCKTDVSLSAVRSSENADTLALDREDLTICGSVVPEDPSAKGPNVVAKSYGNPPDLQKARPDLSSKVLGDNLKGLGVSKEKDVNAVSIGGRVGDKHQSKLQEKLAFLEGKVKRIASDIKRTKEMLDMNNPDASKVKISDIQEKISGIEKAIGHVVGESGKKSNISRNMDKDVSVMQAKEEGFIQNKQVDGGKISVKGLNIDELEARLLPHQKLLKGRSSIKMSSSSSESDKFVLPKCEPTSTHVPMTCPIDENPIALEFLASLNKQPYKASMDICNGLEVSEVHEPEDASESPVQQASHMFAGEPHIELALTSDERLDEFDDEQENRPTMIVEEDNEDETTCQMREIGSKASTGGWFVAEGESVLLVHADGSCSLHDIANSEEKSMYYPPSAISSNIWRDCWIVRATSADGCSGKYVVAASAGNALEAGFCSWDFYTKEIQAFHTEDRTASKRSILAPLDSTRRYTSTTIMPTESRQLWYKPSGPLVVSTASSQRTVQIFDVRDGERIMKWDVQKPVLMMDNSSPLQWRNRGKVVIAEADAITLWDVGSLNPQAVISVPTSGHKISALHVSNTDAEVGGGVRQRITSSEAEGHDGVFCTADSINILDFRKPSGIGLKIPMPRVTAQSIFSRGDSVYLGCNSVRQPGKTQSSSQVQQFSLRRQKVVNTYALPESNAHSHHISLNQVWGNSNLVMGVCGQGLFVFDVLRDDGLPSFALDYNTPQKSKEVIGPEDMYTPSFDYASSQVLLISRDRPAMFRYL